MILYYGMIFVGIILTLMAVYNLYSATKIEKNMDNYLFIITSQKSYFIGTTLFALAILIIISYQANGYIFDIKVFSIVFFFGSLFFLALSHLIYYMQAKKKLSDYKEFFKEFDIDLNNNCQKLMLKHIYSKEKDLKKVKKIFKMNKKLCEKKD
ncbi:adenylate kinase [Caminibacter sp.]